MTSLTHAPLLGMVTVTQHGPDVEKGHRRFCTLSVLRRSDTRAIFAGFSMVRCAGEPQGSPFRKAVVQILCHLAARDLHLLGKLNFNLRRAAMSADRTAISKHLSDNCHEAIRALHGISYVLTEGVGGAATNLLAQAKLHGQGKAIDALATILSDDLIGLEACHRNEVERLHELIRVLKTVNEEDVSCL